MRAQGSKNSVNLFDLLLDAGAVGRRDWCVNFPRCTCRNELHSYVACRDCAFISDDVCVVAAGVNERHASCVHVRFAFGIVTLIIRQSPRCHDDQAVTRVRVPARGGYGFCRRVDRLPRIAHNVEVRRPLGGLHRQPQHFVVSVVIAVALRVGDDGMIEDFNGASVLLGRASWK